jgi:cardiolipin synthase
MIIAKQIADLITASRGLIAFLLVWLGSTQGAAGLSFAIWLMLADWVGDTIDGPISRRSSIKYQTWIGDHDLEIDMTVSIGLLIYLLQSGYLSIWVVVGYLLLWGLFFWQQNEIPRSYGMLFQTPIYGWFIYLALRDAPQTGWIILVFIVIVIALTWPRFPKTVIPGFFSGIRRQNHQ